MADGMASAVRTKIEDCLIAFVEAAAQGLVLDIGEAAEAAGILTPRRGKRPPPDGESSWHATTAEKRIARIAAQWRVAALGYQHCVERSTCTLRDVYYCGGRLFRSPADASKALKTVCDALGIGRSSVGVYGSARGLICFPQSVCPHRTSHGDLVPALPSGPGEGSRPSENACASGRVDTVPSWIEHHSIRLEGAPELILAVEKEAIFARLVQDKVHDRLSCILLTGKGMPDLTSRAALWRLAAMFSCPVRCLTDCNPFGLAIFLAYRQPSASSSLPVVDKERFHVSRLEWLGLHPRDLRGVPEEALQPLTQRDCALARRISENRVITAPVREAAIAMLDAGSKAELEALYSSGIGLKGVATYIFSKLKRGC